MEPFTSGGAVVYGWILIVIGVTLDEAASPVLLEQAVCQQHYGQYGTAATDLDCEDTTVQQSLASVFGIISFVMSALALVLALPYAWLAGKVQKTTLLLLGAVVTPIATSLFFYLVSHPESYNVKAVLVPIFLNAAGGGPAFAFTLVFAVMAEEVEPDQLAISYYRLGALVLILRLIIRAVSARVLQINPLWIKVAAPTIYASSIPFFLSRHFASTRRFKNGQAAYVKLSTLDADEEDDGSIDGSTDATAHQNSAAAGVSFYASATDLISFFKRLVSSGLLRHCLAICFVKVLSMSVGVVELQWISSRLKLDMSTALYFGSYNMLGSAVMLVLLPYATKYFLAKLKTKQKMELHIMRLSMLVRGIGQFAFALSPGPITLIISITIFVLSAGAYDTFKSLITSFCAGTDVTRLYLVLSAVDTAAVIVGSLIYPPLLSFGLEHGYFGMCLPYFLAASCTFVVWIMLRGLEDMEGFNATTHSDTSSDTDGPHEEG